MLNFKFQDAASLHSLIFIPNNICHSDNGKKVHLSVKINAQLNLNKFQVSINIKINKQYQETTGLIQRLINNTPFVKWCYCGREVLFGKVCVCCLQVCLAWKTISCQTDKGNRVKHVQFLQGTLLLLYTCVEDA